MCHITNLIVSSSISSVILLDRNKRVSVFFFWYSKGCWKGWGIWHFYVRFCAHIKNIYLDFQMLLQLVSQFYSLSSLLSIYFWGCCIEHLKVTVKVQLRCAKVKSEREQKEKPQTKFTHIETHICHESVSSSPFPLFALPNKNTLHSIE